jgi:hypothetical protein
MEFIRTLRERHQTARQEEIMKQAEDLITLSDFDSSLYIAYQGTPLVPIQEEWTSKDIVQELQKVRQNYINSKMKEFNLSKIAAL